LDLRYIGRVRPRGPAACTKALGDLKAADGSRTGRRPWAATNTHGSDAAGVAPRASPARRSYTDFPFGSRPSQFMVATVKPAAVSCSDARIRRSRRLAAVDAGYFLAFFALPFPLLALVSAAYGSIGSSVPFWQRTTWGKPPEKTFRDFTVSDASTNLTFGAAYLLESMTMPSCCSAAGTANHASTPRIRSPDNASIDIVSLSWDSVLRRLLGDCVLSFARASCLEILPNPC